MAGKPATWARGQRPVGLLDIGTETIEKIAIVDGTGTQVTAFGGAGGGGGAMTVADGADVTEGAVADAVVAAGAAGTLSAKLRRLTTDLDAINTKLAGTLTVAAHAVTNAGTFAVQAAATVADGSDVAEGAVADAVVAAGAAGSVSAKLRRLTTDLDAVKTSIASVDTGTPNALGAATSANSQPVVIASDQATFPVTATATGNVASAGTDSGNPVKIGGVFLTTKPTFTNGQRGDFQMDNRGSMQVTITDSAGGSANNTPADGRTPTTSPTVLTWNEIFNGTNWDRVRGNNEVTVLASAARTATTTSSDIVNYNNRGAHIILNVSANAGAFTLTPTIQGKDPISGTYYSILVGSAITTNGINILKVYPGITAVANGSACDILPRTWRISVVPNDATSATYSVAATYVV